MRKLCHAPEPRRRRTNANRNAPLGNYIPGAEKKLQRDHPQFILKWIMVSG